MKNSEKFEPQIMELDLRKVEIYGWELFKHLEM